MEARTILFWLWLTALTLEPRPHGNLNFWFFHSVNKSQIKNTWLPFIMENPTVLLQLANQAQSQESFPVLFPVTHQAKRGQSNLLKSSELYF